MSLVNVAWSRLIVAGRQVKRRFAAGLKAAGQLVNCDDSQVNVPLARLIAAEQRLIATESRVSVPLAWLIEIFTLYLHKKHIIDVI